MHALLRQDVDRTRNRSRDRGDEHRERTIVVCFNDKSRDQRVFNLHERYGESLALFSAGRTGGDEATQKLRPPLQSVAVAYAVHEPAGAGPLGIAVQVGGNRGMAAEHDEPWPGGRSNHYLFDMNRDWFAQTQPETRGRLRVFLDWNPHVAADLHEMGGDSTYFFAPPATPFPPEMVMLGIRG